MFMHAIQSLAYLRICHIALLAALLGAAGVPKGWPAVLPPNVPNPAPC